MSHIDDPSMAEAALPYLTDKSADVRAKAVAVIGSSHDVRYVDSLLAALASEELMVAPEGQLDPNSHVLCALCQALADIGDRRAVQPLVHAAMTSRSWSCRISAIDALGRLRDPAAIEPLLALLEKEHLSCQQARNPNAFNPIVAILWALAKIADPRGLKAVVSCLNSQSHYDSGDDSDDQVTIYPVAEAASRALKSVGEAAVDYLIEALNDRKLRFCANNLLHAIHSDRVRFVLEAALRDNTGGPDDFSFRSCVAEALSDADAAASSVQAVKQFIAEVRSELRSAKAQNPNYDDFPLNQIHIRADKALRKLKERMP